MKLNSKLLCYGLVLAMTHTAWAQDDFGGDFTPPPPSGFGGSGSDSGGTFPGSSSTSTGGGKDGTLSKTQKEKFAKSALEDITDENFPETIDAFDYPNADIQDIVKAISELTGKNFIIDQGLRGKITILAPSKITVAEAYKAFLSALAINGYALVPQGKFLKIRSARNAQRDSIETYSGTYYPNSDSMITRIIHLKHIQAEAVNRDLRILTSKDGEMSVYPPTNSLILSDYGSNIDRVMKIINQLDVPGFEDQLEVVPVKYAKAKDLADLIDKIVNKGQSSGSSRTSGGFTAGVPRFSRTNATQGSQGSSYYTVYPDDRTNSLIVVGNKPGIARIKKLLSQLDFRMRPEDSGGVYVYYVKHGDAEKIAQTLSGIAKDAAPKPVSGNASPIITSQGVAPANQEIFGGDVKITADKGTNSLVVVASKQDYEVVINLLNKIDIPRDQVYVESVIVEMKSTDALDYQIGYFQYDKSGSGGKIGFNGFKESTLQSLLLPTSGNGTILGFGSGDKVSITPPTGGTPVTISSLIGFINFLKTNQNANVLSTPQILALDAQEALIEVGDKVVTGSTQNVSATGQTTITPTFEDATIQLKIKPFISPTTNSIRMELKSSVKQLSVAKTPAAFENSTQPIATRKIETNIVVRNGDTAVLGGLQKEDDLETIKKVPLLGDIPILGWLFKSRSTSREKTNMLIFLTPKIIRTAQDGQQLLGQKMEDRQKYIKNTGGRDPYGEKMDSLQKRAAGTDLNLEGTN
jgi:general secretion pathway protein D